MPSEGNSKCKGPEMRIMSKWDGKKTNVSGEKEVNGKVGNGHKGL